MNILVAEDNKVFQKILSFYIVRSKHTPIIKNNGQEALYYLLDKNNTYPDFIISDMYMPVMNGIEFIKNLRKFDKKTEIMLSTTNREQHNKEEYEKQGLGYLNISHFCPKTGDMKEISKILSGLNNTNLIYK